MDVTVDVDDLFDVYDSVENDDARDKLRFLITNNVPNEPVEYAPFEGSKRPLKAADNDDVHFSVVDGSAMLWAEKSEESQTLDGFATLMTDHESSTVTPAQLRRNEQ